MDTSTTSHTAAMLRLPATHKMVARSRPAVISRAHHERSPDVSRPFTRESLQQLKSFFKSPLSPSVSWHPAPDCRVPPVTAGTSSPDHSPPASPSKPFKPYAYDPSHPRHAAVLVALANVAIPSALRPKESERVQASILLEVRSSNMRSHGGEVRQVSR